MKAALLFILSIIFLPLALGADYGGTSYFCEARIIPPIDVEGGTDATAIELTIGTLNDVAVFKTSNNGISIDTNFNASGNQFNDSINLTIGFSVASEAGAMNWSATNANAGTYQFFHATNDEDHNFTLHLVTAQVSNGQTRAANTTANWTFSVPVPMYILSNNTPSMTTPQQLIWVDQLDGGGAYHVYTVNTPNMSIIGNCTIDDRAGNIASSFMEPNTSRIALTSTTGVFSVYNVVSSGACPYLQNYSINYQPLEFEPSGAGRGSGNIPVAIGRRTVLSRDLIFIRPATNGQLRLYVNTSLSPSIEGASINDTTVFFEQNARLQGTFNDTMCVSGTAQLLSNFSGDLRLNTSLGDATAYTVLRGTNGNYSLVNVTVPVRDPRECNSVIQVGITYCNAAAVCVNSSFFTYQVAPFLNVTQGVMAPGARYQCINASRLNVIVSSNAIVNATAVLLRNGSANVSQCGYYTGDARPINQNATGDECHVRLTYLSLRPSNITSIYRHASLFGDNQFSDVLRAVAPTSLIIVTAAGFIWLTRRKT